MPFRWTEVRGPLLKQGASTKSFPRVLPQPVTAEGRSLMADS